MGELAEPDLFALIRVAVRPEGAFGVLLHAGIPVATTCERTYQVPDTASQLVKIPPGRHRCRKTYYIRGEHETYEVIVPGHTRLLFHRGNAETDSEGCVLVGVGFGRVAGAPAVVGSAAGFAEFMRLAGGRQEFSLLVWNVTEVT